MGGFEAVISSESSENVVICCSLLTVFHDSFKDPLCQLEATYLGVMAALKDFCPRSCIWGTKMKDIEDHLIPGGRRQLRARTHIFSTALDP